ncbi:MAG: hypothetical protein LIO99_10390 [Clostridiales bacterium]|nr:hypothetical protein [Clostridiales bacterium]
MAEMLEKRAFLRLLLRAQTGRILPLDILKFCLAAAVCIGFVPTFLSVKAIAKKHELSPKGLAIAKKCPYLSIVHECIKFLNAVNPR